MPTITYQNRVDSVLVSLASLPTATPTRSDTEQPMTEENMTLTSIGKYSYTFSDPEKELSYQVLIKNGEIKLSTVEVYGETEINYNTITEGNEYFEAHFWADEWFTAENDRKQWALNEATSRLNDLAYKGNKTVATQVKSFPRDGNQIPVKVRHAHLDVVLALLQDVIPEEQLDNLSVSSRAFAGVRTTLDTRSAVKPWIMAGIMSSDAWRKLTPYLVDPRAIRMLRA